MKGYLILESQDPFECGDLAHMHLYKLAHDLLMAGNPVTIFLVQNAVLAARVGSRSAALSSLALAGVEILADEFALRERGIGAERCVSGVRPAPLGVVVDRLAAGVKAIWH